MTTNSPHKKRQVSGVPGSYFLTFEWKITMCCTLWEFHVSTWHIFFLYSLLFVLTPPKKNENNKNKTNRTETQNPKKQETEGSIKMKAVLIRTSLCPEPYFAKFSLPGAEEPLRGNYFLAGKRAAPKIFREKRKRKAMPIECTKQEVLTPLHKKVRSNTVLARRKRAFSGRY